MKFFFDSKEENYFSKLKLVYFFLVQYVAGDPDRVAAPQDRNGAGRTAPPPTGLHCVLRHSLNLVPML
jgi:hypothetical protein